MAEDGGQLWNCLALKLGGLKKASLTAEIHASVFAKNPNSYPQNQNHEGSTCLPPKPAWLLPHFHHLGFSKNTVMEKKKTLRQCNRQTHMQKCAYMHTATSFKCNTYQYAYICACLTAELAHFPAGFAAAHSLFIWKEVCWRKNSGIRDAQKGLEQVADIQCSALLRP